MKLKKGQYAIIKSIPANDKNSKINDIVVFTTDEYDSVCDKNCIDFENCRTAEVVSGVFITRFEIVPYLTEYSDLLSL